MCLLALFGMRTIRLNISGGSFLRPLSAACSKRSSYTRLKLLEEGSGGPRSLYSLMGGISSESVFGFFNFIEKHQAASANG
jgi:hypothetical protein